VQTVLSELDDELDLSRPKYNFSLTMCKSRRLGKCGVCCRCLTADMSVLNCRTHDVIHKSVLYLRINFHLSNLTRSPTMQYEVFFFWHKSPWWNLVSTKVVLHCSRSCYLRLQFLTPMFFRSSSSDSHHLNFGIPKLRVPSGLRRLSFMLWRTYWILKRCPSHRNLPIFITWTVCSSS